MRPSPLLDTQLIDAIQWSEPEQGTLAYRYPMLESEIQTGATLTVRESEMAVFVDQGRIADVFAPGRHALNAAGLPLLAGLKNWAKGFASPFNSDIYFFSTKREMDQKWGTSMPIMLGDKQAGAILLRSYGLYSYRIADPRAFFAQVSGTREGYFVYDLEERLRRILAAGLEEMLVASGGSYANLIADEAALGGKVMEHIGPAFAALGLELMDFTIQTISLQDAVEPVRDGRIGIGASGDFQSAPLSTNCFCCGASMRTDHGILKCDYCHDVVVPDADGDGAGIFAECEGHGCPVCGIALLQATIGKASLLYCTRCDGMLVAMEEFEALIAASRALGGGAPAVQATQGANEIVCPQCRHTMEAQVYGGTADVAIDGCESCGLRWLDHGELARIAHAEVSEYRAGSNATVNASGSGDSSSYFNTPRTESAQASM